MKAGNLYKSKIKTHPIYSGENFKIFAEEKRYDHERGDTKIIYEDENSYNILFWISGNEIKNFMNDLSELIFKYRI